MSEVIAAAKGLRYVYPDGAEVALRGVELSIGAGEVAAILAANGGGKTTLLKLIAGLLRPAEGRVRVFGLDPYRDFERVRTRLGAVFQYPAEQVIGPTVRDDVGFGLGHLNLSRQELGARVDAVLERLGIAHLAGRIPHYLSAGELKKVALAGALAARPELLILDEPFAQLDTQAVEELAVLLKEINRDWGTAIIFTSHQPEPAAMLAETVYVLAGGGVAARGTPREVFSNLDALAKSRLRPPGLFVLADILQRAGLAVEPHWDAGRMAAEILAAAGMVPGRQA